MSQSETESKETEQTTALAQAPKSSPKPIAMDRRGVVLSSVEELFRFASLVMDSGMAPKGFTKATVVIAIQMGAELGLPPLASLQNIAVVNGRPSVWGDAVPAICMASGVFDHAAYRESIEYDETTKMPTRATCTVRRLPYGGLITRNWTLDDAKRAKLLGKAGPWSEYTPRMMQLRARSWAMRDAFPDALRGFPVADRESGEMVDGPPAVTVEQIDAPARPKIKNLDALTEKLAKPAASPPPVVEKVALTQEDKERHEAAIKETSAPTKAELAEDEKMLAEKDPVFALDGAEDREPGADVNEPPPFDDEPPKRTKARR